MRHLRTRLSLVLMCAVVGAVGVRAQAANEWHADTQIWPEATLSFHLRPDTTLQLYGTIRPGRDATAIVAKQAGIGVGYALNRYLSIFGSYRYIVSDPVPGRHQTEHRYFFDLTGRVPLGQHFMLSDRNRVEVRDMAGNVSHRYRNRVQVECDLRLGERRVAPYAAYEIFYDDRFDLWSRRQYFAGTRLPLGKHLTLDTYFMRQLDVRARPGRVSTVGIHFRFDY